jgi:hypothetical protein
MEMEDDIKKLHALINHKKAMIKEAQHELLKLTRKKGSKKRTDFQSGANASSTAKDGKGKKSKMNIKRKRKKPNELARGHSSEGGKTTQINEVMTKVPQIDEAMAKVPQFERNTQGFMTIDAQNAFIQTSLDHSAVPEGEDPKMENVSTEPAVREPEFVLTELDHRTHHNTLPELNHRCMNERWLKACGHPFIDKERHTPDRMSPVVMHPLELSVNQVGLD